MIFGSDEKKPPRVVGLKYKENGENVEPEEKRDNPYDPDDQKYRRKQIRKYSLWLALIVLVYALFVFFLVMWADQRLPMPLTRLDAASKPETFIEERARVYLKQITSVGPRPAGSYENEILAVDFLKREINSIKSRAKPAHKITLDIQKPRGSYNLQFMDGMTHHYRNIQNVIVKVEPAKGANDALLINCHFDSVPSSPGASDDAVSCAIMLEVLDVITQNKESLKHNLIFLFNGAEENLLPGSHGFITQHEWASDIRAFINLEACGAGGREVVFQSGPNHPWMIQAYGEVAPHPFASVVGQEIFQSGIIPADTDFRIFRDYGKIPGLDIAYVKNGYVYHTKYDTESQIPLGSIQRAGDNLLAIVKHIANSDILAHTDLASSGHVVFFDLLGFCLVCYPEWAGVVLNLSCAAFSIYCTYMKMKNSHQIGISPSTYRSQLFSTFFYQTTTVIYSLLIVIFIATALDALGKTMSWYSKPYLILFLYVCPTLFVAFAVYQFALPRQKKNFHYVGADWAVESLYFEVNRFTWTFFLVVLTLLRIQSAYFCFCFVFWPSLGRIILEKYIETDPTNKLGKGWKWMALYLIFQFFPLVFGSYMMLSSFSMFIPIMGRSGSAINPELMIGIQCCLLTLSTYCYLTPLITVIYKPNRIVNILFMTTLITLVLVIGTRLGFPYSSQKGSLAIQRALVFHTHRESYNKDGKLSKEDSGYVFINLDRNSPRILIDHVPELYEMRDITQKECDDMIFCGIPVYYPGTSLLRLNNWVPAPNPRIYRKTGIELLAKDKIGIDRIKLLFQVEGPDHMGIYFSPSKGVSLNNWSFVENEILSGPIWKDDRKTYFIFYSHGLNPTTWQFWLELKIPKTFTENNDLLNLAIAGHFLHGNEMKSPEFKYFLSQFPSWSEPVGFTVSYKSYQF